MSATAIGSVVVVCRCLNSQLVVNALLRQGQSEEFARVAEEGFPDAECMRLEDSEELCTMAAAQRPVVQLSPCLESLAPWLSVGLVLALEGAKILAKKGAELSSRGLAD